MIFKDEGRFMRQAPVSLVECAENAGTCPTRLIWKVMAQAMVGLLKSITMAEPG